MEKEEEGFDFDKIFQPDVIEEIIDEDGARVVRATIGPYNEYRLPYDRRRLIDFAMRLEVFARKYMK